METSNQATNAPKHQPFLPENIGELVPKLHFKITSHPNFISSAALTKRGSFPGLVTSKLCGWWSEGDF